MVAKKQMLRGKSISQSRSSLAPLDAAPLAAAEAEAASEPETEAQRYLRFHKIAAARKLALSSRDFEVADARIEDLYNLAQQGTPNPDLTPDPYPYLTEPYLWHNLAQQGALTLTRTRARRRAECAVAHLPARATAVAARRGDEGGRVLTEPNQRATNQPQPTGRTLTLTPTLTLTNPANRRGSPPTCRSGTSRGRVPSWTG